MHARTIPVVLPAPGDLRFWWTDRPGRLHATRLGRSAALDRQPGLCRGACILATVSWTSGGTAGHVSRLGTGRPSGRVADGHRIYLAVFPHGSGAVGAIH